MKINIDRPRINITLLEADKDVCRERPFDQDEGIKDLHRQLNVLEIEKHPGLELLCTIDIPT